MRIINRIALILALSPVLLILFVSSLNLKEKSTLKILVWETPQLRLGTFLTLGTSIGYISSLVLFSSINMAESNYLRKRIVKKSIKKKFSDKNNSGNLEQGINDNYFKEDTYTERDIRDPLPTISIPFRVIKKDSEYEKDNNNTYYQNEQISNFEESFETRDIFSNDGWSIIDLENW